MKTILERLECSFARQEAKLDRLFFMMTTAQQSLPQTPPVSASLKLQFSQLTSQHCSVYMHRPLSSIHSPQLYPCLKRWRDLIYHPQGLLSRELKSYWITLMQKVNCQPFSNMKLGMIVISFYVERLMRL